MGIRPNAYVILILGLNFICCWNSSTKSDHDDSISLDTQFTIGDVEFPNDSIANRDVLSRGNTRPLQAFFQKGKTRSTLKVGFIGGSITSGALATTIDHRYSSRVCRELDSLLPDASVLEVNAGVPATNSWFGCYRLMDDLLKYDVDMVVIEFAVNDPIFYL